MSVLMDLKGFVLAKENRKMIVAVVGACVLLLLLYFIKNMDSGEGYVLGSGGSLVAVERENADVDASYPVKVTVSKGDERLEKNLVLTLPGTEVEKEKPSADEEENLLERQIAEAVSKIEKSDAARVSLPLTAKGGYRFEWEKAGDKSWAGLLLMPFIMILALFESRNMKRKEKREEIEGSIRKELPGFSDQLVMLMNSGLIFKEAFERVAWGYERSSIARNYFREMILRVRESARVSNKSILVLLGREADEVRSRDLSRMVNIVTDNQLKGVDLREKLRQESNMLWKERKKYAEERGKLAETRLTMPLALLLATLILITAAPAIIQVKGG